MGAVLDAANEALDRIREPDAEHPPPSRALRMLARVAEDTETSVLGASVVGFARLTVEQKAGRGNGARAVADPTPDEEAAE